MRILHASESLSTGVLDVVSRLASQQAMLGHEVHLVYSSRPDSPGLEDLSLALPGVHVVTTRGPSAWRLGRTAALRSRIRELLGESQFDVVHLHSTFAGVAGRVTPLGVRTIYSPHGFSFLRGDAVWPTTWVYRQLERYLARNGDLIVGVSSEEVEIARADLFAQAGLLRNVVDLERLPRSRPCVAAPPIVVNSGRWSAQKAPERFERAAEELGDRAEFRWIGAASGQPKSPRVSATGWLSASGVMRELGAASVMYFTSRWEGMPVGLIEAQAMGVPAVAMRCIGVEDVVINGVTGIIVDSETDAIQALRSLLDDRGRLESLASASWLTRQRFSANGYGERSLAVYEQAGQDANATGLRGAGRVHDLAGPPVVASARKLGDEL